MRRSRLGAVLVLLALTAACGNRPGPAGDAVAVAAGSALDPLAETTTTTSTTAPPPPTTTTTTTTARPATTTTRPAAAPPRTTVARAPSYSPPPPPPGVVADGYGGYGGIATATGADGTVAVSLYPRQQYFGEPVQIHVVVTTTEYVGTVQVDMGNGTVFDLVMGPQAGNCTRSPREVNGGTPSYAYPAAGPYVLKATVTIIPCIPIAGPPELPPGAPSPFERHTVVATIGLDQRADRPPPPVGPPPGA